MNFQKIEIKKIIRYLLKIKKVIKFVKDNLKKQFY